MSVVYSPWACMPVISSLPEERIFLVRHNFTTSGYSLQITDAHTVWTEQLDRRRIIGRALDEDTAIDPSEDATQLGLLLDHLRDALSAKKGAARLRILDISRGKLNAEAMSALPRPLKDLRWPFRLSETPGCTVGTELAAPLLSLAYVQTKQIQRLVQALQQKDAAIDKLLEKIEAAGLDLGVIFPAVAGNKKHKQTFKRAQVLQQIQGLRPFGSHDWPEAGDYVTPYRNSVDVTISEVMEGVNLPIVQKTTAILQANFRVRPKQDAIHNNYDGDTTMDLDEPAPKYSTARAASPARTAPALDPPPDSDFQRQATPPNLAQKPQSFNLTTPTKRTLQRSSSSVDQAPSPPQASRSPSILAQPPPVPYSSKPVTPSPARQTATNTTTTRNNNLNDDDDTTDDDDLDAPYAAQQSTSINPPTKPEQSHQTIPERARSPTSASTPPETISPSKPALQCTPQRTKLGGLGRRAQAGTQKPEDARGQVSDSKHDEDDNARPTSSAALSTPPKTKLGRLGGTAKSHAASASSSGAAAAAKTRVVDVTIEGGDGHDRTASELRGRVSADTDARPADRARSTSLERADRKREELKRQLAEQERKAAATKKKRRF